MSNGSIFGLEASPREEMEAFDKLPPELRALLNDAPLNFSALQLARAKPGGMRQWSGVFIEEPDERKALLDGIAKQVDAMPTPLKPLRAYQPTVAERRALKKGYANNPRTKPVNDPKT
jgi:hypothetical protein